MDESIEIEKDLSRQSMEFEDPPASLFKPPSIPSSSSCSNYSSKPLTSSSVSAKGKLDQALNNKENHQLIKIHKTIGKKSKEMMKYQKKSLKMVSC